MVHITQFMVLFSNFCLLIFLNFYCGYKYFNKKYNGQKSNYKNDVYNRKQWQQKWKRKQNNKITKEKEKENMSHALLNPILILLSPTVKIENSEKRKLEKIFPRFPRFTTFLSFRFATLSFSFLIFFVFL